MLKVVHFGGGSLGLGLVVATLVEAKARVTVVDADTALVDALSARGGYDLEVHDGASMTKRFVPIATAMHSGTDLDALRDALMEADLVTTSVRVPNLSSVAAVLDASLNLSDGDSRWPHVIACENLAGSSRMLAAHGTGVRSWTAERVSDTFLDAEVDRICQTAWPRRLAVATEPYREWVVVDPEGALSSVPGVTRVNDLAPFFDRKRAFVNAVADAYAFLGVERGQVYLHEAASDVALGEVVAALRDDLIEHVARWPQFAAADLRGYAAVAVQRLANPGIRRRLDTVARDLERKLAPGERFVEPALGLLREGHVPTGVARVIAKLIDTEPGLWARDWEAVWGGGEAAKQLWGMVVSARRTP